jgi:hypothetical protein
MCGCALQPRVTQIPWWRASARMTQCFAVVGSGPLFAGQSTRPPTIEVDEVEVVQKDYLRERTRRTRRDAVVLDSALPALARHAERASDGGRVCADRRLAGRAIPGFGRLQK